MSNDTFRKAMVFSVILFFAGTSIASSIGGNLLETDAVEDINTFELDEDSASKELLVIGEYLKEFEKTSNELATETEFLIDEPGDVTLNRGSKGSSPLDRGGMFYVGGTGPNNYSKIQDALDNATDGDTIYVYNGVYNENVIITKKISLIGQDSNMTVISGDGSKTVVYIEVEWANLSNFSIKNNASSWDTGIHIHHSNAGIEKVTIYNCTNGIYITADWHYASPDRRYVTIDRCLICNNSVHGIYERLRSYFTGVASNAYYKHCTVNITDALIQNNGGAGVYLYTYGYCKYGGGVKVDLITNINDCNISNNGIGINTSWHQGSRSEVTYSLNITTSNVEDNTGDGIFLDNIDIVENLSHVVNNGDYDWHGSTGNNVGNWTWYNESSYNFTNLIKIGSGHKLVIEPGSQVIFSDDDARLDIRGRLFAEGYSEDPITFSNSQNQSMGYNWGGITFNSADQGCILTYCNIFYAEDGISVRYCSPVLENLVVLNCSNNGIAIHHSDVNLVESKFHNCTNGIYITADWHYGSPDRRYVTIDRCLICNNSVHGIYERLRSYFTGVASNAYYKHCTVNITDALIQNNGGAGVYLYTYGYCKYGGGVKVDLITNINDCNISNNGIGINTSWHQGSRSEVTYTLDASSCNVSYNDDGIILEESKNANIFDCTIANNARGIYLCPNSNNNKIFHNRFILNQEQACDCGHNIWNDSYLSGDAISGGNYWSNYNGSDMFKGPNQDIPGKDGIGDTPHNISGGSNKDNYPIMTYKITILIGGEYPMDRSTGVNRPPPELNATIHNLNGDAMDVYISWKNHTGEWVTLESYAGVDNGTYNTTNLTGNAWIWGSTTYTWSVYVTDGAFWTSKTYHYTTGGSRYDVNNNDIVNFQDAGLVWIHRTSEVVYDGIYDVNQNGVVNFQDAGLTWVNRD